MEKSLKELALYLDGKVIGDENIVISGIAALDEAGDGDLTFVAGPKYASKAAATKAAAILFPAGMTIGGKNGIEVKNVYLAFAKILTHFRVKPSQPLGVMEGAHVGRDVVMGQDVTVYPGVFIGDGVRLGDRVTLHPGVTIYEGADLGDDVTLHSNVSIRERCRVGSRVIIHCGAVIGSDGFGYAPDGAGWYKIPQVGIVVIEDDVEIGANTTIDRAALDVTLIRRGTKIDNLVQIAHNCIIGENCMIVAQVGIAGSTRIGNHVTLAGQVGTAGHITIGDNTIVGGQGGVTSDLPAGSLVSGSPAYSHRDWLKVAHITPRLPEMRRSISALEKKVQELERKLAEK